MCFPIARFRVVDRSMEPIYQPGDFVLVNRWAYHWSEPRSGDTVVLHDPEQPERLLLKRIARVNGNHYFVEGDNKTQSRDSWQFGWLGKKRILGKVCLHARSNR